MHCQKVQKFSRIHQLMRFPRAYWRFRSRQEHQRFRLLGIHREIWCKHQHHDPVPSLAPQYIDTKCHWLSLNLTGGHWPNDSSSSPPYIGHSSSFRFAFDAFYTLSHSGGRHRAYKLWRMQISWELYRLLCPTL